MAVNDPDVVALNLAAAVGVADAESVARLFSLALDGTLLSNATLQLISKPTLSHWYIEQVKFFEFTILQNNIIMVNEVKKLFLLEERN